MIFSEERIIIEAVIKETKERAWTRTAEARREDAGKNG